MALVVSVAGPARGQEPLGFLQPLIAFLSAQTGIDLEAELAREPGAGALINDPANDFEHISGERPRFTPEYLDIREGATFEIDPGVPEFFAPTNRAVLWSPTGPREIEPPGESSFFTFTTNLPKDGTQYQGGALLFRFGLQEAPPPRPEAVCDYTVWAYDVSRGAVFQNLPEFPADPATGSNLAFGVRLTPEDGAVPVAFALALDEQGDFQTSDTDTRAFVMGETVSVFVPRERVGELASVNYHAVCSVGSAIDPTTSGADQTGLSPIVLADAGAVVIMETPSTATPTVEATTTIELGPATTVAAGETPAEVGTGSPVWAPVLATIALLGAVSYWAFARRRNPEERALAAWRKAEGALAAAETEAEPLVVACLQASSVVEDLEHERVDLCRVWPPACLEEVHADEEATAAHDQHFRRMALGELWFDYKEGKIGADQVEARWRAVNTPEFQSRMRETNEAYRETLDQLDNEIATARSEMELACPPATSATTKTETARQAAFTARRDYLDRLEVAPQPPASSWVLTDCDQSDAGRLVADGATEHLRVNVGFMISVGRFVGRERNLERGERLILEMEGLLHELELVPRVNRARRGATHVGWTGHEYEPGVYWVTGEGIRRGETDQGLPTSEEPQRPTPVVGAETELTDLPGVIGDHASSKVAGWMTGFETLSMQRTFFHQLVTTRPYTLWECRDGNWTRAEDLWRIEIGEPLRNRGEIRWFSIGSPGRQAQFETEVNRIAWVASSLVTRDLRRLLRWRARSAPETQTRT